MMNPRHPQPLEVEVSLADTCPFCEFTHEKLWTMTQRGIKGCASCGQPKIQAPTGNHALSTRQVHIAGVPVMRVYTMPKGKVEIEVLDADSARAFYNELNFALLRDSANRGTCTYYVR